MPKKSQPATSKKTTKKSVDEVLECSHKTYQGVRAPKVDCAPCWKKYFETDTDAKKKKYEEEYKKYMTESVEENSTDDIDDSNEEDTKPKLSKASEVPTHLNEKGEEVTEVPIRINTYYWSDTLQATVKINGYSNGMISFLVDNRMIVPETQIEKLRLVPYGSDFFVYTTRRIPPGAENKKITVFTPKVIGTSNPTVVAAQGNLNWQTNEILWPADAKIAIEDCPQPVDPDEKPKKKRKKKTE